MTPFEKWCAKTPLYMASNGLPYFATLQDCWFASRRAALEEVVRMVDRHMEEASLTDAGNFKLIIAEVRSLLDQPKEG